jgi:hypothetical protein
MSETPLPQTLSAMQSADAPDETSTTGEFRARRRSSTADLRPVSAFAPGHGNGNHERSRNSEPPASAVAPSADDQRFAAALRASGVASELTEAELARATAQLAASYLRSRAEEPRASTEGRAAALGTPADEPRPSTQSGPARRLDLLVAYYGVENDPLAAQRRQATDRWFLFQAADALTAPQLLARLLDVVPELQGTELERVGGQDGTLVVRAGDDVCALEDEREEDVGTQSTPSSGPASGAQPRASTISVCDLVRALNVLLDRRSVRARLVGLIGDGSRDAYLGLPSVTSAIVLSSGDYLAVADAEALLDLTGW